MTALRSRQPNRLTLLERSILGFAALAVAGLLGPMLKAEAGNEAPSFPTGAAPETVQPGILAGRAVVIDGDTMDIGSTRIRLHGVDAFERDQVCTSAGVDWKCGEAARLALAARMQGRAVVCERRDTDRYGRTVARCSVDGEDLAEWLVARGHALAYRRYSLAYVDQERAARMAGAGAWAGWFEPPETWRRGRG